MNNSKEEPEEQIEGENGGGFEHSDSDINSQDSGEVIDTINGETHERRRRRTKRRVKVKTRVRVKRKTNSRKKYKKILEQLIWVLFIAGFVTALVILYQQLGINDSKYKSNKRTMLFVTDKSHQIAEIQLVNKQKSTSIVVAI